MNYDGLYAFAKQLESVTMDEIRFLKFEDWQKEISRSRLTDLWITVYDFHEEDQSQYATFCCVIPNKPEFLEKVVKAFNWDIEVGYGHPRFWQEGVSGQIHYERFGGIPSEVPIEPLVIYRSFHGRWGGYLELSEEFRLYHNLYYDNRKNEFIFLNESGEEDVVAQVRQIGEGFQVHIKTKYLRDFLAAKSMVLVRFHDHRRFLAKELTDVLGKDLVIIQRNEPNFCFRIALSPKCDSLLGNRGASSRFLGKDILAPLSEPLHHSYMSLKGKEEKKYVDFIIRIDEYGNPIEYACNPDVLSNSFGANPGAPNYITPVFFRREVLKQYYDKPSKYSVEDNYIRCGYLWGMRYGQNPVGLVHAWLGDLGRDLPYNEQLHWRRYNVPPEGGLGKATVKRELLAEFADPDEITHIFKYEFKKFSDFWKFKFGWNLFLPLRKDDEHFMKSLHVPTSEDALEFDQQIQAFAKILPDSINVSELEKLVENPPSGPINLLQEVLVSRFKVDKIRAKEILQPLWDIQSLRSSSVAHRKGTEYDRIAERLGLNKESSIQFFKKLLEDTVGTLKQLQKAAEGME